MILAVCNSKQENNKLIQLVTLDPGHFHAALVQKTMYEDIDPMVHVYAPGGDDLQLHLNRINGYNTREENPTHWSEEVYAGKDFFEKMIEEKKGNVVVLSGNNEKKSEYILKSLENGFNVLADKPMVINSEGFAQLKEALRVAKEKKLLLYDIMTERYEITTELQRELSMVPEIFGTLEKGTAENPAVEQKSEHYLYKFVSGNVLTRPAWFLDISQQGEGIADVMTHLVDLVQWECFPGQAIDTNNIKVYDAKHWATDLTLAEFTAITHLDHFPGFLEEKISGDSILHYYCNGEINYTINGIHARTSAAWNYRAAEGTGDTHYSVMHGTRANLIIRQGPQEQYEPTLYIEPVANNPAYEQVLTDNIKAVFTKYNGGEIYKINNGWKVKLPENLKEGHEAHFARVTEKFIGYLKNGNMPGWEVSNMIAKYYTTIKGLEMALKKES